MPDLQLETSGSVPGGPENSQQEVQKLKPLVRELLRRPPNLPAGENRGAGLCLPWPQVYGYESSIGQFPAPR